MRTKKSEDMQKTPQKTKITIISENSSKNKRKNNLRFTNFETNEYQPM